VSDRQNRKESLATVNLINDNSSLYRGSKVFVVVGTLLLLLRGFTLEEYAAASYNRRCDAISQVLIIMSLFASEIDYRFPDRPSNL
jgi:hypothetical protein